MNQLRAVWLVAAKDLRIEYRSRQSFQTTLFFALLILIVFQFAFDPGSRATRDASAGILWVALIFPGMMRLNQSFQLETEEDAIYGLVLSPIDRGTIFLGKFLSNWVFMLVVGTLTTLAFLFFFKFPLSATLLWLALFAVLGLAGLATIGTVLAGMVANLRSREALLPILMFPLVIPIVMAGVNGTEEILVRGTAEQIAPWLRVLAVFDIVYAAAGYLVFEYVVGE